MNIVPLWNKYFSADIEELQLSKKSLHVIEQLIIDYLPTDSVDQRHMFVSANRGHIMKYAVLQSNAIITEENADKILSHLDSFNRPEVLYLLFEKTDRIVWLNLFRSFWTMCDSCSLYHEEFKSILRSYDIEEIRSITHNDDDIEFYNSLPETFEVYRGTFNDSRFAGGISWTTDIKVAEFFQNGYENFKNNGPMVFRYKFNMNDDKFNLLKEIAESGTSVLTRTVNKKDIFVNTNRGENEIFIIGELHER